MRSFTAAPRAVATALLMAAARADALGEATAAQVDFLASPTVAGLGQWPFDPVFPSLPGLQDRAVSRFGALESATDRMRRLRGFTDVSLGARWRVRGGDAGWMPGVAWLADVEATMGSPAFRDGTVRPSLRATAQWELPSEMSLGVMHGVYRDRGDDGRHYAAGVLSVTLGKSWTPRLQSFVEVAGQALSRMQSGSSLFDVDTGVAFTASKTLMVDLVVSRSLQGNASQDVRGGLSVSSRF